MASAKKITINGYAVQLTLTAEEAETIFAITRHIGGSGMSRRRHTDAIGDAFRELGVSDYSADIDLTYSGLRFIERS